MGREIIVENIYYALHKYDSENNILNKAMYLSTAVSLLKALVQREGLKDPIELTWYSPKKKEFVREEYTHEKLIEELDKMTQKIVKTLEFANKQEMLRGAPVSGDGVYWLQDLLRTMGDVLAILEPIKQMVLEILVLAGYDEISLVRLEELEKERK